MEDFLNKVVVVNGAAGNLGEAVVRAFLETKAKVVAVGRSEERLKNIFSDLVSNPDHFLAPPVDSTDQPDFNLFVDQVIEKFGGIDILVNTVGGYSGGVPLHETQVETLDRLFILNAKTTFIASQAVIPHMLTRGAGKIVNVAARPGLSGRKNMGAYSASKAAVIRLTESMAAELKTEGINVNCIIPGTIDTPQNREAMPEADSGRWVAPTSLAEVIMFLSSKAARDIHGAAIPVFGLS